jgi:alkanesulfonate monooxygenase SsuD/methylene tetrahydromethanopterin reductase-like flavin-dependent oxidoreductase (luciferase family)
MTLSPLQTCILGAAMDFGIFTMFSTREGSTQSQVFREWLSLVQVAEDSGLDTLWLGESHFRPQRAVLASPLVGASAVAARTRRIRVGLAVQVLPLANPLRVAEEAAIVDHLSEGRLVFGVGRSSFLEAYEGYNVAYAESRALFLESLTIIRKAWTEETFSHDGTYYHFHDVQLVPKTYQRPHPPIRVAVESRETFALAGKLGFPIFIRHQMDIPELQDLLKQYQEARHAAGFSGPNDVILQIGGYVADTAERARSEPEASTMRGRRLVQAALHRAADPEAFERLKRISEVGYDDVLSRVAYGTPDAVVERLLEYRESLGITGVSLDVNPGGQIPYDRVVHSIRLLTDKVMPKFR